MAEEMDGLRTNLLRRLGRRRIRNLFHLISLRIVLLDRKLTNLGKTDLLVTRQTVDRVFNAVAGRGLHSSEHHICHLSLWKHAMATPGEVLQTYDEVSDRFLRSLTGPGNLVIRGLQNIVRDVRLQ